jgi:hypothetical protein
LVYVRTASVTSSTYFRSFSQLSQASWKVCDAVILATQLYRRELIWRSCRPSPFNLERYIVGDWRIFLLLPCLHDSFCRRLPSRHFTGKNKIQANVSLLRKIPGPSRTPATLVSTLS